MMLVELCEKNRGAVERSLTPIHLTDFKKSGRMKCPAPKVGQDLAEEVRQCCILDFSNWKNHDDFEKTFMLPAQDEHEDFLPPVKTRPMLKKCLP